MRLILVLFFLLSIALTGAGCEYGGGPSYAAPPWLGASRFSQVQSIAWTEYESIGAAQESIYLSTEHSAIALPAFVEMPSIGARETSYCHFRVIGKFKVTSISEQESSFEIKHAVVVVSDWPTPPTGNEQECAKIDKNAVIEQALQPRRYQKKPLNKSIVSRFDETMMVFGPRAEQPFPYQENVFIRSGANADLTPDFFSWFNGPYLEPYGVMKVDRPAKVIEADVPNAIGELPPQARGKSSSSTRLCHLKFKAPVSRVTVESHQPDTNGGLFAWFPTSAFSTEQMACLQSRFSGRNLRLENRATEIGISLEISALSGLRFPKTDNL